MQLGLTIPLQKFLQRKAPPYGEQEDLFFCWDLHVICFQGKETLVAVNGHNRFGIVIWDMKEKQWSLF